MPGSRYHAGKRSCIVCAACQSCQLPAPPQVQESAASSVAQFAGLLSHQHRHEHLSAIIDALMHNFDGAHPLPRP